MYVRNTVRPMVLPHSPAQTIRIALATLAGLLLLASGALAQEQSKDQQKCINTINKRGAAVAKGQGKENQNCLKNASAGNTDKLGGEGQTLTAQACLTNDPKQKVGKKLDAITNDAADKCTTDPPDFGFTSAAFARGDSQGETISVVADLFGTDLDAVTLGIVYTDDDAPDCQFEVLRGANGIVDTLWKLVRKAKKDALKGKDGPPVTDADALTAAIEAAVAADSSGKLGKSVEKLEDKSGDACGATAQALGALFPAECAGAADPADLADCAERVARCHFCRSLAGVDGLAIDCDSFDDGMTNLSCPCFAAAREITNAGDLMTGPLAHGQIGDYLLENDTARFIIQDVGLRDMYSVGCFGGNIIDAELVANPGNDNFLEIQPAVNIETVINAQTIEIVNDGANCAPAIIRTCGPDDVLDFVNASTVVAQAGLPYPASADDADYDVTGCTEYRLARDVNYLEVETTITSSEVSDLGLFVGDYLNAAGEVEQWSSGNDGIGPQLTHNNVGVVSYFGFGQAEGVDYSHVPITHPDSVVNSSIFSVSGVSFVLHSASVLSSLFGSPPTFEVPAGGSESFVRYFGVGDGSGANAIEIENVVKSFSSGEINGCVTLGGAPIAGARVTAGPESGGMITEVAATWVTDANGCYEGTLPEGDYGVAGWREGTPFEGGGGAPTVHLVSIAAGVPVTQDIALPATGTLSVTVTDENSTGIPARVTVVGFDPSPEFVFTGIDTTGLFRDQNDVVPFGITRFEYADATGAVSFDVEPGMYQVFVSRGTEYSSFDTPVTITAGMTTNVAAQIGRVLDTTGFVSSDFHVHGIMSADSRVTNRDRIFQYAGEGVDNIVMTEHHGHNDLTPDIASLGFTSFVTSTVGEEITTWDTGHFNGYPFTVDSSFPSGGSTDWGKAAAPGMDFPSLGSYSATPAEVETLATTSPRATPDTIVQINHIDSHFVPLEIDTSVVPPASGIGAAQKIAFRIDPASGNLFNHFPALELWNGNGAGDQSQFLDERIGIWFNHLNQGLETTFIADTDSHKFDNLGAAGASTWTASSTDSPASISSGEVANSVEAGKAVGGQGIYVQTRLVDNDDAGNVADLTLGGTTLITIASAALGVTLEIDVQAPTWAEYDTIEIYANAATTPDGTDPELFDATPTVTLTAPGDFTVTQTNVHAGVPGADRLETSTSMSFTSLPEDMWFVVVVKGTGGTSEPMFPIYPSSLSSGSNTTLVDLLDGNLGEGGTLALGATNALYVDADGVPGFQGPDEP